MSELKSCPFCGSNNVSFVETEEQPLENSTQGFIYCHGCGFSSDVFHDCVIAKKHWNRRAEPDNEPLTLEQLREVSEEDEFGGAHIWIKDLNNGWIAAAITDITTQDGAVGIWCADANDVYCEKDYGKTWLAYRYKPEEV